MWGNVCDGDAVWQGVVINAKTGWAASCRPRFPVSPDVCPLSQDYLNPSQGIMGSH